MSGQTRVAPRRVVMAADQLYVHQVGGAHSVTLLPDSVRFLPAFLFLLSRHGSSLCSFAFGVFFLSGSRLLFLASAAVTHRIVVSCCSFVHFAVGSAR